MKNRFWWSNLVLFATLIGVVQADNPKQVEVWLTTFDASSKLERQEPLPITTGRLEGATITVKANTSYQEIDGFGASLTESSAWLMAKKLSPEAREKTLQQLFNPTIGIGLSFLRQPMGASDFALGNYTYDDLPSGQTDPKLEKFSIAHDKDTIIPILKRILEINPNLKIMGTPWSPPAWMKTTNSVHKGKLKPGGYTWLALYFLKFIQAYANEGLPIYAISLQNEPYFEPETYPGMFMSPQDQIEVVKILGPMLKMAGLKTKILTWDHNWDHPEYPKTVLDDNIAREYIAGTAFHCYAGQPAAQSVVQTAHPDKEMYFTECSGGAWSKSFRSNLQYIAQTVVTNPIRNWSRTAVMWNLALDEEYGPKNGGCPNCRGVITINQKTGNVDYNVEFYALGQASKFVQAGAKRIGSESTSSTIQSVAFKNPDGSLVLMLTNTVLSDEDLTISDGVQSFKYSVPGNGVISFIWK
jgi:glucosylceramidase